MKKLKNLNVEIGEFNNLSSSCIDIDLSSIPKNIKITQALLPLKVTSYTISSLEAGIGVHYSYDKSNVKYPRWENIDLISGVSTNEVIYINITDELQDAILNNANKLILNFVPTTETNEYPFVNFMLDQSFDVQYISNATYQNNGAKHSIDLGHSSKADIDLVSGSLSLSVPIMKSDNNALPLSLSMNYNSNLSSKWNFNIQQKLICDHNDDKLMFRYIDGDGKEQIIEETYYYLDENNIKQYISRHDNDGNVENDMYVDVDGTLKYKLPNGTVYDVQTSLQTQSGLTLVSSIADIKGSELVDHETEELANINAQIKKYEQNIQEINETLVFNKKQFCLYALSKAMLIKQLKLQEDSVNNAINTLDFQAMVEKIKKVATINNRYYRLGVNDSNDGIKIENNEAKSYTYEYNIDDTNTKVNFSTNDINYEQVKSLYDNIFNISSQNPSKIIEGTIIGNESGLMYAFGMKNESGQEIFKGSLETQRQSNDLSKEIYIDAISQSAFEGYISSAVSEYKFDNNINYADLWNEFKYTLNEENKFVFGYKDLVSIDLQLENLVANNNKYINLLEEYNGQIKKLQYQKEQYELQLPVHYLFNEQSILGFAKTSSDNIFRLTVITDYYENLIKINYKDFDTDELVNVVDANDNTISFAYNNDNIEIIDTRERKTVLKFEQSNLIQIDFYDETKVNYCYDDNNNLTVIIDNASTGVMFEYITNKVESIKPISLINNIVDGNADIIKTDLKQANLANYVITSQVVNIIYNDYKSTQVTNAKGKSITYLFDEYGKVRNYYENTFNEEDGGVSTNACEFRYNKEKRTMTIKGLQKSDDFLKDMQIEGAEEKEASSFYLGDDAYCSDVVTSKYLVSAKYSSLQGSPFEEQKSEMSIDVTELTNFQSSNAKSLVLSGWASADSAFIVNQDEVYKDQNGNSIVFPNYITRRKFHLIAKVTYQKDGQELTVEYQKAFDWMNKDWQYCAVHVPLEYTENNTGVNYTKNSIKSIVCSFDFSYNLGNAKFTKLALKEAQWEETKFVQDEDFDKYIQTQSHSQWIKTTFVNKDTKLIEKVVVQQPNDDKNLYETKYFYNKNNKVVKTIDHNGIVKENIYNNKGTIIKTLTYHKDEPSSKFYEEKVVDEKGFATTSLNELGEETIKNTYIDNTGIVLTQTQKDGTKTSFGYDPNDTMLEQTTTVDGIENTNTFGYTLDFLTSLKHNNFAVGYDYDNQGRITKIKIADNEYLTKEYTAKQEVTRYATGEIYRQTFDNNGNVVQTHYTPKPTAENANPTEILLFTNNYDTYGNLIKVIDTSSGNENITTVDIDKFGNTTNVSNKQHDVNIVIENVYDENQNNISETKFSLNSDIYSYTYSYEDNPDAKLKNITLKHNDNENNILSQDITYDNLGRLSSLITNNNSRQFTYLKSGDHTTNLVSMLQFGYGNINTENIKYKYDEKGNISEIRKNGLLVARYKYDGLSRLVREDNAGLKKTYTFNYDAGGNILSKLEYNFTLVDNLDYEVVVQTYNYSYPATGWRDQLKEFNGEIIDNYDELGNPWLYRGKSLEWSHGRQLDIFADVEFTYNGSGIRTSKISNGFTTKYYLNGNKIIRQQDASNDMHFHYGADGLVGFSLNNNEYTYKKNAQNDIIGIYDASGTQICKYIYDAWGNQICKYLSNSGEYLAIEDNYVYNDISNINRFVAYKNPFRYRSYYYDFETGLYYLNSRYYDPETGRFINADDISTLDATQDFSNGLNLYAYCLNNPINTTDEDGNLPNWLKWLIGGLFIVVGIVVSVVTAGTGTPIIAAIGTALLNTTIQVGISMAVSIGVAGIINIANNRNFFDNIGDTLADGFMWGGIFAGSAQILSGGFKLAAKVMTNHGLKVGMKSGIKIGKTGIKILSPNSLNHYSEVGGTLIKFGKYARIDVGTKFGLHLHTIIENIKWLPSLIKHFPIGAIIGGIIGGTR